MARVPLLEKDQADPKAQEVLAGIEKKSGKIVNIFKAMAHSPAVLEAYTGMSAAMGHSSLDVKLRERIALAVGQESNCDYCLAAHGAAAKRLGLSPDEIESARRGESDDPRTDAALKFAVVLVKERGWASDGDVESLREAGFSDAEMLEIVAAVSFNLFTNYFNHVAGTPVDFPAAPELAAKP